MWRVDQGEAAGGRRADHATVARPGGATGDREGAERFLPADRSISFVGRKCFLHRAQFRRLPSSTRRTTSISEWRDSKGSSSLCTLWHMFVETKQATLSCSHPYPWQSPSLLALRLMKCIGTHCKQSTNIRNRLQLKRPFASQRKEMTPESASLAGNGTENRVHRTPSTGGCC